MDDTKVVKNTADLISAVFFVGSESVLTEQEMKY